MHTAAPLVIFYRNYEPNLLLEVIELPISDRAMIYTIDMYIEGLYKTLNTHIIIPDHKLCFIICNSLALPCIIAHISEQTKNHQ